MQEQNDACSSLFSQTSDLSLRPDDGLRYANVCIVVCPCVCIYIYMCFLIQLKLYVPLLAFRLGYMWNYAAAAESGLRVFIFGVGHLL